ncbi:ATP-binding protein [uncultured Desulfosarcina sp.]|uniref:hybrid sensor histidine kinase/response regulator n=1 Tax=uncultured Desulfosarcina sp. TaxID=218289 RepID=UPI0029C67FD1|nr:ATP-binding protein [uncultured Desulfosarcina sp.]
MLNEIMSLNIISSVVVIFIVIFIFCVILSYSKIIDLRKSAVATANEIASFIGHPLYVVDDDQAIRIAETFLSSKKIAGFVIESSSSGILSSKGEMYGSKWIPKITKKISEGDIPLGRITITFSDEEIYRNIAQLSLVSIIIIVAVFVVFNFTNRFLVSGRIKQTVAPILAGLTSFSEGNYETFLKPTPYVDVNIVVDHFNDTAAKIHQNHEDLKKSKEALIAERRYLMDIIDFLPDATFIVDTEKKIVAWNRAAEALTNVPREQLLGKGNYEYALPFHGERRPVLIDIIDAPYIPPQAEKFYKYIKRIDTAIYGESYVPELNNGQGADFLGVAAPLFDQKGNRTGAIELVRDISDYKQAEKEKQKLQLQLKQVQKMEAIGTLAGGIAHDFNNILTAIIGYVELAIFKRKEKSEGTDYLDGIFKAASRAKDLVQQILAFSRQTEQVLKPVSVKLATREALKLLRASLPSSIEIKQNLQSNSLVMGDPTQLHQIMMNLFTNAAHAMQKTGGTIDVEITDIELDEPTARSMNLKPKNYFKVIVRDTGCGMPPKIMDRIFDPFFTTKALGAGTGMGLSVVHGIVESFDGKILVDSEPGQGTRFQIFLPVVERTEDAEMIVEEDLPRGSERILVVDDEPDVVIVGKETLETLGYRVTATTNPVEAMELLLTRPREFDLLITDMTMPKMTGDTLAREVLSYRPGFPVILCTGFSAQMTEKRANKLGIKGFLMKPILRSEIAKLIRNVLDENQDLA